MSVATTCSLFSLFSALSLVIELEKHHETNHNVIFCFYPVCSLRGS